MDLCPLIIPINAPTLAVPALAFQEAKKVVQQNAVFVAPKQDGWVEMSFIEIIGRVQCAFKIA